MGYQVTSLLPTSPSAGCPGVLSADVTLGLWGMFSPSAHSTSALMDLSVGAKQGACGVRTSPPNKQLASVLWTGDPVPTWQLSLPWPPPLGDPGSEEAVGVWLPLEGWEGP